MKNREREKRQQHRKFSRDAGRRLKEISDQNR